MHPIRVTAVAVSIALTWVHFARAAPAETESKKLAAPNEPEHVITPGHEDEARELLRAALDRTPELLSWRGPSIQIDRIEWWLVRGDQTLAELVALPRALGESGAGESESFTILVREGEGATLTEAERELLAVAVASIQANDRGEFYVSRKIAFAGAPPYMREQPSTPAEIHRRWALEFSSVGLLVLFGLAVTFRREPDTR